MNNSHLQTFISVKELEGKTFKVKDYQRGYKWGKSEISQLLDDLEKHDSQKGTYCLQPIIVKPITDLEFEVIDGQQRLTSLYLLMQFFGPSGNIIHYNIEYGTRPKSQLFLTTQENFSEILNSESWNTFIQAYPHYNNVDIFHFYEVFKAIQTWFSSRDVTSIINKINEILYIIWYDVSKGNLNNKALAEAEDIFINFNANKVDLSSSELIKALFILDYEGTHTKEQKKHKAIELALEWDAIENKLQDNTFWYFICNDKKYNQSATRIDFFFDLVSNEVKNKDNLAAYRKYEKLITSEAQKDQEWKKIKTYFYKLEEWFNDNEKYHQIGFLIATKILDIQKILSKSDKKGKTEFKQFLKARIRDEFQRSKDGKLVYNLETLNYKDNWTECNRLLLLLNVLRYLNDVSKNKFPFNLFHEKDWSLEHINPQNPKDFKDIGMLKNWIKSIQTFFHTDINSKQDSVETFQININRLEELVNSIPTIDSLIKNHEFLELIDIISEEINIHDVTNLALLDRITNSVLGNRPYLEKREKVLAFDRKGSDDKGNEVYIPLCTRDIFTKTYSFLTSENVGTYFTAKDMADYKAFIETELKDYLPQQSTLNESI